MQASCQPPTKIGAYDATLPPEYPGPLCRLTRRIPTLAAGSIPGQIAAMDPMTDSTTTVAEMRKRVLAFVLSLIHI